MSTETTKKPSFTELINGDTPVLVDFYADWCGPCKMMPPILKELKSMMGDKLTIIKIDTEKNPDLAIRYNVRGIPNLALFKEGKVVWQKAGVMQAAQLKTALEPYL